MTKLEIYGIILIALLASIAAAYFKGHHNGYVDKGNEIAASVLKADAKIDSLNESLRTETHQHAQDMAVLDQAHTDQLRAALAGVKPVIVRVPASGVQTSDAARPAGGATGHGPSDGNLPTSVDLAPAELVFAGKYQQCRDSLATYQAFYAGLQSAVNHAQ